LRHLDELLTALEKREGDQFPRHLKIRSRLLPLLEEVTRDRETRGRTLRKFYMLWQGGRRESDWEEEWLTVVLESMWKRGAREGEFRSHEAAATRRYGRPWKPERTEEAGVLCTALMRAWGTREDLLERLDGEMRKRAKDFPWVGARGGNGPTIWAVIEELVDALWRRG